MFVSYNGRMDINELCVSICVCFPDGRVTKKKRIKTHCIDGKSIVVYSDSKAFRDVWANDEM